MLGNSQIYKRYSKCSILLILAINKSWWILLVPNNLTVVSSVAAAMIARPNSQKFKLKLYLTTQVWFSAENNT